MRYFFTTIPGSSHMLPLVPLAHAALAAGHEVLVATSGSALPTAVSAGLHTVAVNDGESARPYEEMVRKVAETSIGTDLPDAELVAYFASVFGEVGTLMADGLVETARIWGADAVVYPAPHVAGLLTARAVGIPAVLHGLGTRRPTFGPALAHLAPVAQRMNVAELREADVELDLSPPSLETIHQDSPHPNKNESTLPMRYAPYNGGAQLPDWLLRRGDRRRVAVTLGSLPAIYGDGVLLREIVEGTANMDIELVLTAGGSELHSLPAPLPDHVRLVDWMPMRALLPTCDAIIHHGGMGTMYAAFDAGVPQLAIPVTGTDSVANAKVAVARGVGQMLDMSQTTASTVSAALHDLLGEPAYVQASQEVATEMRAMPTPGTVIAQLTNLLGGRA